MIRSIDDWYNPKCECDMCITYKKNLLILANEIEEIEDIPQNYFWDDTWEFIALLPEKC